MIQTLQRRRAPRFLALALTALLCGPILAGLTGCGNHSQSTDQTDGSAAAPNAVPPAGGSTMAGNPSMAGNPTAPPKPGMSTKEKVVIVAGATLLYYLYEKHQAAQKAQAGTQTSGAQPQLFRSSNGGVYYRNPQNPQQVTWLTVPNQPMQVPASELQQYAPDYSQYQGQPAPSVPAGQPQQSFTQYDPSLSR